jgi:hypothetical protein
MSFVGLWRALSITIESDASVMTRVVPVDIFLKFLYRCILRCLNNHVLLE